MTSIKEPPSDQLCFQTSTASKELIHVDCASHVYPDGTIGIHQMCFRVLESEIVALCGPNGSGKSTLIEHLNGLLTPSEGKIVVRGRLIGSKEAADLWKDVGIAFQRSDDQLFAPTVLDDVMFGPINMGLPYDDAKSAALSALKAVGASDIAHKLPNFLSGGQKRLISIAGILAMKPKIIALDEPTSDLDPLHSNIIERLIIELKNKFSISVVIATHDLDFAARIADRVCLVRKGSICAEGSPKDIFYNDRLINGAGLQSPAVVQLYRAMCKEKGISASERPLTIQQLVEVVSKKIVE